MSSGALFMMLFWQIGVTVVAGYFFYRVLTSKPKKNNPVDEDSYLDNDSDSGKE